MAKPSTTRRAVPVMRPHTFREYDEEWEQAVRAAAHNDEDISEVIRVKLREYVTETNAAKAAAKGKAS